MYVCVWFSIFYQRCKLPTLRINNSFSSLSSQGRVMGELSLVNEGKSAFGSMFSEWNNECILYGLFP